MLKLSMLEVFPCALVLSVQGVKTRKSQEKIKLHLGVLPSKVLVNERFSSCQTLHSPHGTFNAKLTDPK